MHAGQVERLRAWLDEVGGTRRKEAIATLADEGCHHELGLLVRIDGSWVLVYVMEVDDLERSKEAAVLSTHSIDAQHKEIMGEALGEEVPIEVLLDLRERPHR